MSRVLKQRDKNKNDTGEKNEQRQIFHSEKQKKERRKIKRTVYMYIFGWGYRKNIKRIARNKESSIFSLYIYFL